MSIEQNWKKMNEGADDDLSSLLHKGRLQKMHSSNPLQKIKYYLVVSIAYAILIAALYIYVLIRFPYWQVIVCIGAVLLFTCGVDILPGYNIKVSGLRSPAINHCWRKWKSTIPASGIGCGCK